MVLKSKKKTKKNKKKNLGPTASRAKCGFASTLSPLPPSAPCNTLPSGLLTLSLRGQIKAHGHAGLVKAVALSTFPVHSLCQMFPELMFHLTLTKWVNVSVCTGLQLWTEKSRPIEKQTPMSLAPRALMGS